MKRKFKGKVISDKMNKTRVVLVEKYIVHPIYQKKYKISKKYKAHDEKNEYKTGDIVFIEEVRPISREKRWKIIGKIQK